MGRSRDISKILNDAGLITAGDLASGVIPAAGKNVQAVSVRLLSDAFTTTSSTWVSAGSTVTLTPSSTNSKILLLATFTAKISSSSFGFLDFVRGSTQNISGGAAGIMALSSTVYVPVTLSYVDSPSTTSSVTYGLSVRTNSGSATLSLQELSTTVNSTLIAIEIGG